MSDSLESALRLFTDRDASVLGGEVTFRFASHGEAMAALRSARAALATASPSLQQAEEETFALGMKLLKEPT